LVSPESTVIMRRCAVVGDVSDVTDAHAGVGVEAEPETEISLPVAIDR
jgi:hypothetical protein